MIRMFVGDDNSVDRFRTLADGGEPFACRFPADSGVYEDTRPLSSDEGAIAGAAAGEDADLNDEFLPASTLVAHFRTPYNPGMGTTASAYLTIPEFDALPQPDDRTLELHEGELVEVTYPNFLHSILQERIRGLLSKCIQAAGSGVVMIGLGLQISDSERQTKRRADVAFLSNQRDSTAREVGFAEGAPELVVEILSPSNTMSKLNRYARLCLASGSEEFWTVDPETQTVRVRRKDRIEREYEPGETIQLGAFMGNCSVGVSEIFEGSPTPANPSA
jgi:Uma2 family endonuclease